MWRPDRALLALLLLTAPPVAAGPLPDVGRAAGAADLAGTFAIPPAGTGLPAGHGSAADGKALWEDRCAACHGDALQGIKAAGGPALAGGRGTLTNAKPTKTVESYWPYATTLFDYIKRAMPFNAPGSLSDDEVYAAVAFILAHDGVIAADAVMDARSLPKVVMPNANGFVPDPRPGAPAVLKAGG